MELLCKTFHEVTLYKIFLFTIKTIPDFRGCETVRDRQRKEFEREIKRDKKEREPKREKESEKGNTNTNSM